jgi:hypothetical protein
MAKTFRIGNRGGGRFDFRTIRALAIGHLVGLSVGIASLLAHSSAGAGRAALLRLLASTAAGQPASKHLEQESAFRRLGTLAFRDLTF